LWTFCYCANLITLKDDKKVNWVNCNIYGSCRNKWEIHSPGTRYVRLCLLGICLVLLLHLRLPVPTNLISN